MRTYDFQVGDTPVSLRLTAEKLEGYVKDFGQLSVTPLVAVLEACDNVAARAALLTRALAYPGNTNTFRSGHALMDAMADEGWGPDDVCNVIVQIACDCGQLAPAEAGKIQEAVRSNNKRTMHAIVDTLNGVPPVSNLNTGDSANPTAALPNE